MTASGRAVDVVHIDGRASRSDLAEIGTTFAEAMVDDPVHRWSSTRPDSIRANAAYFRQLVRAQLDTGFRLSATSDRSAAALWCDAARWDELRGRPTRALPEVVRATAGNPRSIDLFVRNDLARPDGSHAHLLLLGVRSAEHGKGIGTELMRSVLDACGVAGTPMWTWSSNPRNLRFYERLGFETIGWVPAADGSPPCASMWWQPDPAERSQP